MGWILYLIGGLIFFYVPDPDIAGWGGIIFLVGMLFHWRFWLIGIASFFGGYFLFRN